MSGTNVWIAIPTYNEAENIDLVVRRIRDAFPTATIVVVDDNSPDGTAEKAEALASEIGGIHVLAPAPQDGARERVPRGLRRRPRPRLRRDDRDRRRPVPRPGRPAASACARSKRAPTSRSGRGMSQAAACRTGRANGSSSRRPAIDTRRGRSASTWPTPLPAIAPFRASMLRQHQLLHRALERLRLPGRDGLPRRTRRWPHRRGPDLLH